MIENDFEFTCPHCGEELSIRLDVTAGEQQAFIYDCEVCCRPIQIQFEIADNEVLNFSAEATD